MKLLVFFALIGIAVAQFPNFSTYKPFGPTTQASRYQPFGSTTQAPRYQPFRQFPSTTKSSRGGDGKYQSGNDGKYRPADDGKYRGGNDGKYSGAADGQYNRGKEGDYDGINGKYTGSNVAYQPYNDKQVGGGQYQGGANSGGQYRGSANSGGQYQGGASGGQYQGGANSGGKYQGGANSGGQYQGSANNGGQYQGSANSGGKYQGGASGAGRYNPSGDGKYNGDESGKYSGVANPYQHQGGAQGSGSQYRGQSGSGSGSGSGGRVVQVQSSTYRPTGVNTFGAQPVVGPTGVPYARKFAYDTEGGWRIFRDIKKIDQDGYAYEYETENKIVAAEQGRIHNRGSDSEGMKASGFYEYVGDDGIKYRVDYIADENGFQPVGAHIPTVPPAIARALAYVAAQNGK